MSPSSRLIGPAAAAVAALLAAGLYVAHADAMRARLMMADPDTIPGDAGLRAWALPRGRAAYADHCASCHGAGLAGDPSRAIPDLGDGDWLYGSGRVGEIERIILYGIRSGHPKAWNLANMPAFATANPNRSYKMEPLSPQEVADVAAYVYSLRRASTDPAAVARGDRVYHKNGFCFDCHGGSGRGDSAIGAPDLTDAVWLSGDGSLEAITETVAHGLEGICPEWIDRLPPATIRSIAVYVNSVSHGGADG
jgi:cytochrome c oxidase cbb3-type subunit 3